MEKKITQPKDLLVHLEKGNRTEEHLKNIYAENRQIPDVQSLRISDLAAPWANAGFMQPTVANQFAGSFAPPQG